MYVAIILGITFVIALSNAYAEVYIPDNEYKGYYNSEGLYTVVGVIKSSEEKPVKPIIHLEIDDTSNIIKKSIEWVPILNPSSLAKEIPFKIIIPEVKGDNPIIRSIDVEFQTLDRKPISVMTLYDDTLRVYEDHVKARAINLSNETINNVRMYAVAHGSEGELLDVAMSIETLDLKPNEIKEFTMYIDPIFAGKVAYFSCFAPSDPLIMNLTTTRYNEQFEVYAEGYIWLYNPKFDEDNNILYINSTNNSVPLPFRISLMLPLSSLDERFKVYLNDKQTDAFQSMDQDGMRWHLSFDYPPITYIHEIKITGFAEPNYKYIKLDTNNTRVIAQIPREIMPMEESEIRLAFYNLTNYELMKDIDYNIKLIHNNDVILDLDRIAINGIDTITYTFEDEGVIDMQIKMLGEERQIEIVVVPEFPTSVFIITISMISMLIILRHKLYLH